MAEALISPRDYKAVCDAALCMPEEKRLALLDDLTQSLEGNEQLSSEWMAVIQQRLEDYKSGKTVGIPADVVHEGARRRIGL
jgi:putative addiction module component (TIGR02574 family)